MLFKMKAKHGKTLGVVTAIIGGVIAIGGTIALVLNKSKASGQTVSVNTNTDQGSGNAGSSAKSKGTGKSKVSIPGQYSGNGNDVTANTDTSVYVQNVSTGDIIAIAPNAKIPDGYILYYGSNSLGNNNSGTPIDTSNPANAYGLKLAGLQF